MRIKMLKPYYIEVQAVRITQENFQKLKELDTSDGVLEDGGSFEDYEGDWFVSTDEGYSIYPGYITLIPVEKKK